MADALSISAAPIMPRVLGDRALYELLIAC